MVAKLTSPTTEGPTEARDRLTATVWALGTETDREGEEELIIQSQHVDGEEKVKGSVGRSVGRSGSVPLPSWERISASHAGPSEYGVGPKSEPRFLPDPGLSTLLASGQSLRYLGQRQSTNL